MGWLMNGVFRQAQQTQCLNLPTSKIVDYHCCSSQTWQSHIEEAGMEKSSTSDFVSKESSVPNRLEKDTEYDLYIGLDVHKASVAVAVAERGRGSAQYRSEISNTPKAVRDLVSRLEKDYSTKNILYCYEDQPVRLCSVPSADRVRKGLRCGCAVVDPPTSRRPHQDRPERFGEPGRFTPLGRPDLYQCSKR